MQSAGCSHILSPKFLDSKIVQVAFDTSAFCNARCESCIWPYMDSDASIMGVEDFRKILDRFQGFSFSELAFNVINEPFVDRTICQKLWEVADRQVSVASLFFSSNWLLPKPASIAEFVETIAKCDTSPTIKWISLNATVCGINEETYDRGQAGSTLRETVATYRRLDFHKAVANVCSVIRQLAFLHSKKLRFYIKAYSHEFDQKQMNAFWWRTLLEADIPPAFVRDHVVIVLNHAAITFARFEQGEETSSRESSRICASHFLTEKLVIGARGELGLCCQDGIRSVVIGNILEKPLMQLVLSDAYQEHLQIVTGLRVPMAGHPCLRCEFYTSKLIV